MELNHECAMRINGVGGPGARHLDPREFEEVTGISCSELPSDEPDRVQDRPQSADWSPRDFGDRFFPDDEVDPGKLDV